MQHCVQRIKGVKRPACLLFHGLQNSRYLIGVLFIPAIDTNDIVFHRISLIRESIPIAKLAPPCVQNGTGHGLPGKNRLSSQVTVYLAHRFLVEPARRTGGQLQSSDKNTRLFFPEAPRWLHGTFDTNKNRGPQTEGRRCCFLFMLSCALRHRSVPAGRSRTATPQQVPVPGRSRHT